MKNTCDRCRHWGSDKRRARNQACDVLLNELHIDVYNDEPFAHAEACGVYTEPDFGCIKWEARE